MIFHAGIGFTLSGLRFGQHRPNTRYTAYSDRYLPDVEVPGRGAFSPKSTTHFELLQQLHARFQPHLRR
jgi:hypothetical protein